MSSNSTGSNPRRGRGGRRGGRGGRGHNTTSNPTTRAAPAVANGTTSSDKIVPEPDAISGDSDEKICWICAEPVKFYALSECNHRTCHVCALRLRALYKRTDCTFCKHSQVSVIFTTSPSKVYPDFTPNDIPFSDPKLQISFETKEMMEDTMILLRFNCPDPDCDVVAQGWSDLKWHAKEKHDSILCDLCIRHKKIFAHEHTLYSPVTFGLHMPSVHTRRFSAEEKEKAGLPDMVHPMCQFCRECSFGDDELFAHLREHHEECFVCKREGVRDQYFRNYEQLEQHFRGQHYPCTHHTCLEQKFVVFSTQLDLQGHQVDVHGEQMSSRDRRDARRIDVTFGSGGRGGRGRGGGRGDRAQASERTEDRAREPPPQTTTQPPPQPGPAPGRGSRRAAFGASLTVEGPGARNGSSPSPQQEPPRPSTRTPDPDVDPETLEQHNQFLSLLNLYAPTNGALAIRGAIRSYKLSESSAKDMLATIRIVVDDNMNVVSTLVNGLVPLFDEEKRKDTLNAWNGMKIEQRDQFPSLTPTSLGSGFADIASGRVLNVKHSTRSSGSRTGSSSRSTGALWDRVERVAAGLGGPTPALQSSAAPKPIKPSAFPPLGGSVRSGASSSTPWSSGATAQTSQHLVITPARALEPTKGNSGRPPPIASSSAFPELPSSSASRVAIPKMGGNQSLRRIAGELSTPDNAWGGSSDNNMPVFDEPPPATNTGGKGKKKKGKETLFTLGSFPN